MNQKPEYDTIPFCITGMKILHRESFSGVGKNFVRELYSEIENKKEYEFLRGNKELELIFEEHLK